MSSFDDLYNRLSPEDRDLFEQRVYNDVQVNLAKQRKDKQTKSKWFGVKRLSNTMDTALSIPEASLTESKVNARLSLADKLNGLTDEQKSTLDQLSDLLD